MDTIPEDKLDKADRTVINPNRSQPAKAIPTMEIDKFMIPMTVPPTGRCFRPLPGIDLYQLAKCLSVLFSALNEEHLTELLAEIDDWNITCHWAEEVHPG